MLANLSYSRIVFCITPGLIDCLISLQQICESSTNYVECYDFENAFHNEFTSSKVRLLRERFGEIVKAWRHYEKGYGFLTFADSRRVGQSCASS